MTVAVIADIISSREAASRDEVQRAIEAAVIEVDRTYPWALQAWYPTVGDEFQAVFRTVDDALLSTLYFQLALPKGVACRFGIGLGGIARVQSRLSEGIQDGPGWWAARAAVERARDLERTRAPFARSWFVVDEDSAPHEIAQEGPVNAYLMARDQLVSDFTPRVRRSLFLRWCGYPQKTIAEMEGVSPSAVSQALNRPASMALRVGAEALELGVRARRVFPDAR
ncbi:SatD family protein [Microbacterium sp. NPDC055683]